MSEPRTEAGKALLKYEFPEVKAEGASVMPGFRWEEYDLVKTGLIEVERQARADALRDAAAAVEGLPHADLCKCEPPVRHPIEETWYVSRTAAIDAIRALGERP